MMHYLHYKGTEMLGLFAGTTPSNDVPRPFIKISDRQYRGLMRNPRAYFIESGVLKTYKKSDATQLKEKIGRDLAQLRSEASVDIQNLVFKDRTLLMDHNTLLYVQSAVLTEKGVNLWSDGEDGWTLSEYSAKETKELLGAWVEHKTRISLRLKADREALTELARDNDAYN